MEILKLAVPNKGRLSEKIYELLNKAGLNFNAKGERDLQVTTKDGNYSVIFLRTQDIPSFVEKGVADIGFTGFDIVTETEKNVETILDLNFGVFRGQNGAANCYSRVLPSLLQPIEQPVLVVDGTVVRKGFQGKKRSIEEIGLRFGIDNDE